MAKITEPQKILFEELHNSRTKDYSVLGKKSYRGIWTTIVDKYPESAHFVYELLQNADDAEANRAEIILRENELIFKHNGLKHFDIQKKDNEFVGDIESITGIGNTGKDETQNKIGKFGVGFKAIFQYTDTPEIYDDIFQFKIENYIIPTLLDHDHPERSKGETLFIFPFKDKQKAHKDIIERLQKLQNPLLFLHCLQHVRWQIDIAEYNGTHVEYEKKLTEQQLYDDGVTLSRYILEEPKSSSSIFLFSKDVSIKKEKHSKNYQIFVGFYYDEEKQQLITNVKRNIYCFFPTKATFNTCFVSHAPFLLIDNRQDLKPSEQFNKNLCNLLAGLAAAAIIHLRDYGRSHQNLLIHENILEIIPPFHREYWYDEDEYFEEPIHDSFGKILREERLLLTKNNEYVSLKEAFIGTPHDFADLISKKQFHTLHFPKHEANEMYFDDDEFDDDEENLYEESKTDFLKWDLSQKILNLDNSLYNKIRVYSSWDLAGEITDNFMAVQDIRWVTRLYTFLRNTPSLWKVAEDKNAPFRHADIIKTQTGDWVPPYDMAYNLNVFLPINGKTPSGYKFINKEYLENPIAMKFFTDLGVQEPDESAYITQIILSKFLPEEISLGKKEIGEDFDALLNYYEKVQGKPEEQHYISNLQNHLNVLCTDGFLRPICTMVGRTKKYLFLQDTNLQGYFANSQNVYFMDLDFYRPYISKHSGATILSFIEKIGVRSYPEMREIETSKATLNENLRSLINITNYKTHYIKDWALDGFLNFSTAKVEKDISVYVWNILLPKVNFGNYETLDFAYRQPYAQTFLHAYYTSSFKYYLQNNKWIFDINGNLKSPHNIALEDLSTEYDRNNGLLHFLGIEKREKSILELGGTEEQQAQMELGRLVKTTVGDALTADEVLQALMDAKARKKGLDTPHKENDASSSIISQDEAKIDKILDASPIENREMPNQRPKPASKSRYESEEEWLEKQEKIERQEHQLDIVRNPEKQYTMEWIDTLLQMELEASGEKDTSKGGIKIRFTKVEKDVLSEKSILLKNPNRNIPRVLEEMSNINVVFRFSNRDMMPITFEVASVQDYILRLKCKNEDAQIIRDLIEHAKEIVSADLNTENPIQLISKLRNAYQELGKPQDYSFKKNINPNIQFVFGPPGTGKTTHLVRKWINKIASTPRGKMLILCPTNKAADVIADRALSLLNPLSNPENYIFRFVATAEEHLNNNVCSRQSNIFYQDKCCVISTIARFSYDGFDDKKLREIDWDYIVIDEASMIPLADILYPLYQCPQAQIVIAGDPFQIEPIVMVDEWKDENIYKMVNLKDFNNPQTEPCKFQITNLSTQYRAVPAIGRLFSNYMYGGGVTSNREQSSQRKLNLQGYKTKSVNFVMCPVERGASIYGAQRLMKSNIHIYSALFTYEFLIWMARNIQQQGDEKPWRIGVISPYRAQADLIDKLWEQRKELFPNVNVLISTVHGFQGDECDIIVAVYNPPASGMKMCADDTFVNKQNILNVAISRAQDYLFLIMPDDKYEYFYKLEATKIFKIAAESRQEMTLFDSMDIEKVLFNDRDYLAKNTFVTSHQLANVYTEPVSKYEVRFDENSVDIQVKS